MTKRLTRTELRTLIREAVSVTPTGDPVQDYINMHKGDPHAALKTLVFVLPPDIIADQVASAHGDPYSAIAEIAADEPKHFRKAEMAASQGHRGMGRRKGVG